MIRGCLTSAFHTSITSSREFLNDSLSPGLPPEFGRMVEKFPPKLFFRLPASRFLKLGTIRAKPNKSVSMPGVINTIPPTTIIAPSISLSVGGRPLCNSLWIFARVERPCCLANEAPRIPVNTISPRVGKKPILAPTIINR